MTLFNLKIMRLSGYAIISAVIFMLAGTANEINAQESDRRDVRRGHRHIKDGNYKVAADDMLLEPDYPKPEIRLKDDTKPLDIDNIASMSVVIAEPSLYKFG